jgi:hypothetical protein
MKIKYQNQYFFFISLAKIFDFKSDQIVKFLITILKIDFNIYFSSKFYFSQIHIY